MFEVRPLGNGRPCGAPERAAAYLTTLLVIAVAAIIVSALTMVAVGQLRMSRLVVDEAAARDTLDAAVDQLAARLEDDPFGYLDQVLPGERARVCTPTGNVYEPGDSWPRDTCGVRWGYQQSSDTAAAFGSSPVARFELTPPSVDDPRLAATVLAHANGVEVGRQMAFFQRGAHDFTAHSDAPLDVDTLFVGTPAAGTRSLYSNSTVYLPSSVTLDDTVFAADGKPALSGVPSGVDNRYFVPRDGSGDIPAGYEWIRDLVEEPHRMGALHAAALTTEQVGCPLGPDDIPATLPDGRTSRLCLRPGWSTIDAAGTPVDVPDDATAVSLRPTVTAEGRTQLQVDVATVDPAPPACTTPCDLTALSGPAVSAGVHPGDGPFWQPLGSGLFDVPASGVVVTGVDTYVGRCPNFTTSGGPCPPDTASEPLTVLAGDDTTDVDLWLSGSLTTDAQLTLVATGEIHVPYFSRPPGGDLTVEAALIGFGDDDSWAGPVNPFPTPVCTAPASGCGNNAGGTFTLAGSVAGPSLDLRLDGWAAVDLQGRSTDVIAAAPYTPSFDASWVPAAIAPIVGSDVCGRQVCSGY